MFSMLLNILALAAAIGVGMKWLLFQCGVPSWLYFAVLPILGVVCYVINGVLTGYYIEKYAPDFASSERVFGDVQKWELTAGLGVVPKWVSWIGFLSIAYFLALLMPVVAPLFNYVDKEKARQVCFSIGSHRQAFRRTFRLARR